MNKTHRNKESNYEPPDPYEDLIRLKNLDPYESLIKMNLPLKQK
tara:strand:- start:129 stop:260 length:132 start_codon:yes stop_codon:yes gene_type:complete